MRAQLIIDSVIAKLDPTRKTSYTVQNLLGAATFGFAFVAGFGKIGIASINIAASLVTASKYLLTGLKEAPMVGRAIWPTGTVDSQQVQIGYIKSELSQINSQIGGMLNRGLQTVMNSAESFALFASAGQFSGDATFNLPESTAGLDIALKTFIISNAMTQNSWYAIPFLW